MMLRRICFWLWSSILVIGSFSVSDRDPCQIIVGLIAFSEAEPLTVVVTVFFKIVAIVEWDMPDW